MADEPQEEPTLQPEAEEEFPEEGGEDGYASRSDGKGIEEFDEEEVEEEEVFSHLGDSSDDPEQRRRYLEYLALIKEIDCQNKVVEEIKCNIMEMCAKPCKTRQDCCNIKRLRTCMEQENLKLQCLLTKAMELQNFGSHRRWTDLPIATTFDEDNMTPYTSCLPPQVNLRGESSEGDKSCQDDNREKEDNSFKCLCKAMGKIKVSCPEDKKLIREIAALLCKRPCKPKKSKQEYDDPCGEQPQSPCQQKPRRKKPCKQPQSPCMQDEEESESTNEEIELLKQKICCMQSAVNNLKKEICKREKEKAMFEQQPCNQPQQQQQEDPCRELPDPLIQCGGKKNTKSEEIQKLKENYMYLLADYAKKDCRLKALEQRMKGMCGSCGGATATPGQGEDGKNAEESELLLLRTRVNEMKEEQAEFKCLMKEQSSQLEEYRQKYLTAQQKVEEQAVTLEKLNMNNKRIEKQINTEVKEIRAKFQEKLNELLQFPKLLENEQLKLAQACKEKDDLHSKLVLVCKELKNLKSQMDSPKENNDCRPQLAKCQMELNQAQNKLDEAQRQRDLICEQLRTTQDDLDTLRSESAKIIARTKERAELIKQQMQEQVNRLEKDLAQCRATACLSVSDREAVIREMQGQLNTLSYSFDAAQKQIKTLRNHIAYVSNENCFPVKC